MSNEPLETVVVVEMDLMHRRLSADIRQMGSSSPSRQRQWLSQVCWAKELVPNRSLNKLLLDYLISATAILSHSHMSANIRVKPFNTSQ